MEDKGYLKTKKKLECFGCEACASVCSKKAIKMVEDNEGFRFPVVDENLCVKCGLCESVCPYENMPKKYTEKQFVFGGHCKDRIVHDRSTSGGLFSTLAKTWSKEGNYVIFGAEAKGLDVCHGYIEDINEIDRFRKSKYSQSIIGDSYVLAKRFLCEGRRVLFSGTPCQIAALHNVLGQMANSEKLLTIEVVCEGFPSPLFLRKYTKTLTDKYGGEVKELDYRFKDNGRWDFQVMLISITSKSQRPRTFKFDRWFSPFWVFWARRLMSRNSCESCPFRTPNRVADVTLGDLWGVHKYCPDLYDNNRGATLTVCNTEKGKRVLKDSLNALSGRELNFDDALQFQRPMRVIVPPNPQRDAFMADLKVMEYKELCKKWNGKEPIKVLWNKYIWGSNRQRVAVYNIKQSIKKIFGL